VKRAGDCEAVPEALDDGNGLLFRHVERAGDCDHWRGKMGTRLSSNMRGWSPLTSIRRAGISVGQNERGRGLSRPTSGDTTMMSGLLGGDGGGCMCGL
jgi:hypothetical protein